MLIQKNILLQLDKDTDPSFRKVEAPIAKGFPQPNKDAQIIGYKKSLLIENHYKAKKLCDVEIVDKAEITDELSARMNLDKELVIIKQKCETNENKMVCIHKKTKCLFTKILVKIQNQ